MADKVVVNFTVRTAKADRQVDTKQSIVFEVTFARVLTAAGSGESMSEAQRTVVQDTLRGSLNTWLEAETSIIDVLIGSTFHVSLLGLDGRSLLNREFDIKAESAGEHEVLMILTEDDVKALSPIEQSVDAIRTLISRPSTFVSLTSTVATAAFAAGQVQVAPISDNSDAWWASGFGKVFTGTTELETVCAYVSGPLPTKVLGLDWSFARLAVDGSFVPQFSRPSGDTSWLAWAWLFTSKTLKVPILGVVNETLAESISRVRSVFLPATQPPGVVLDGPENGRGETTSGHWTSSNPASADRCDCIKKSSSQVPMAVSELELADNPEVYNEDPGSFCEPFSNPARIVSERSFFSVVRTEQPVISAEASITLREPAQIDFDPPDEMLQGVNGENDAFLPPNFMMMSTRPTIDLSSLPKLGPVTKDSFINSNIWRGKIRAGLDMVVDDFPKGLLDRINALDRGRRDLDATHPVQWDSESIRYQATTIARGHILEFRVRTRSNGYSLGTVAKTLTLAPRQTKRIQKVSWERSEFATREENQQSGNIVNDSMAQDSSYQDAVAANLNEWARGSSRSSVTAAAAGVGAVLGPVAIGGGVAHSTATSESQQQGGRTTTGTEEQQWRTAMRRHGDDLRKAESMVVVEVSQKEEVTGTVEVIQNKNYAHSLTVIYHSILRHLRVDTDFGGARECLFVPFAMKPFTMERAYRWRDSIRRALKERRFQHALRYLKDVLTGFKYSQIPPGRRADHPIRSLYGSVFINIGVARPGDTDKGEYDPKSWETIAPFLVFPGLQIFQEIKSSQEYLFQKRFAPGVVAKWADKLQIVADSGTTLAADFTLASQYGYNSTVRIDFQVEDTSSLTRAGLAKLKVKAGDRLTPGSVANLRSLKFTYQTNYESNTVSVSQGIGDLIVPGTGEIDPGGASVKALVTQRELQNLRADLVYETIELLQHLNENVEHYHKMIWWNMDRDRLWMLLDGFFVPTLNPDDPKVSICSVVERNPIGIAGNNLIFRVSAGCYIGSVLGKVVLDKPESLVNWYQTKPSSTSPMHISLPTDGLYAQTIMDKCVALEEHFGNIDWALSDPDPELGNLDPTLLESRRTDTSSVMLPQKMPDTLISLQNAATPPVPQGLGAVLGAVQNANAFKDMAGLVGTQGLAGKGLETAATLATSFGSQAAAIKVAEVASQQAAVADIDKKLASIEKARSKGLTSDADLAQHTNDALSQMNGTAATPPADPEQTTVKETREAIKHIEEQVEKGHITEAEGTKRVQGCMDSTKGSGMKKKAARLITVRLLGFGGKPLQGLWAWSLFQMQLQEGDPPTAREVKLGGSDAPELNLEGRFPAAFNQSSDTANESFEFRLNGEMFPSIDEGTTPAPGTGLPSRDKVIRFKIPKALRMATVFISASTDKKEMSSKTGSEAAAAWKAGGSLSPSGEAAGEVKGWKFAVKIIGELSGEMSKSETETNETTQNWTLIYYTGGFDQKPSEIVVD